MIVTMQEGILSRWFRDRQLAMVIGILLCIARLTKFIAKLVCYPIVRATGSHAWPIHLATLFCALGVLTNLLYWYIMCRNGWATATGKEIAQPKHKYRNHFHRNSEPSSRDGLEQGSMATSVRRSSNKFKFSYKLFLYVPGTFWMIPWIQFIMSSVLSSFDDVAT